MRYYVFMLEGPSGKQKKSLGDKIAQWIFIIIAGVVAVFFVGGLIGILYITHGESAKFKSGDLSGMSKQEILDYEALHALPIQIALMNFQRENGVYPASLGQLVPHYLKEIPLDPATNGAYQYTATKSGLDYSLCPQYSQTGDSCGNANATLTDKSFTQ